MQDSFFYWVCFSRKDFLQKKFCKKHRKFSNRCQPARCAECFFLYTAAAMHQTMMALFVLLWLITDIHVATGTCIACAISGTAASRRFHMTG